MYNWLFFCYNIYINKINNLIGADRQMQLKYLKKFSPCTSHETKEGTLHIVSYFEKDNVLYGYYTLNDSETVYEKKYDNIAASIYRHARMMRNHQPQSRSQAAQLPEAELKRPLKYGVELEVVSPLRESELIRLISEAGIDICSPFRSHTTVTGWKIVRDSSIKPTGKCPYGFEIVSPPLIDFKELEIVCKILKENGVKKNVSTGLHVHHEIKDLKRKQIMRIYEFYYKYESLIDSMMDKRRRNNRFCKSIGPLMKTVRGCESKEDLLEQLAGSDVSHVYYHQSRYYKLNLRSFIFYGTIEFRQHGGSVDFEEIKNWILFTHKIIDRAIQINDDVKPFEYYPTLGEQLEAMAEELKIKSTNLENDLRQRLKKRAS